MARLRSREAETEDVNQRRLQRGAVKRTHLTRWAVGADELAPGIVGDIHLNPSAVEVIREEAAGTGVGQLLIVSATADSIASGGDYVTADDIVYQHGFDQVTVAGDSIVWPVDAVGEIQVEFAWDTYEGGGTIEIEVDGVVPAWGLIASGSTGQVGCKRRSVHIAEGASVKVKVTQTSGSAQTGDVVVEFVIPDPTLAQAGTCLESVFSDNFDPDIDPGWFAVEGALAPGEGTDGSNAWEVTAGAGGDPTPRIDYTAAAGDQTRRWVLRFDSYQAAYPSTTADQVLMGIAGDEDYVKVDITATGAIEFYANGLRYTSGAGAVVTGQWQSWEFDVTRHASAGVAKLTVDDVVLYNGTGLNTGTGVFTVVILSVANNTGDHFYDNVELLVDRCLELE